MEKNRRYSTEVSEDFLCKPLLCSVGYFSLAVCRWKDTQGGEGSVEAQAFFFLLYIYTYV